jgi:RNA polymerase sigma factor (sigma-70 family)
MATSGEASLVEVEQLLTRLHMIDPELRAVVEMKVFEGLSREEIAERLGCSVRTVARHWDFAQQFLQQALA